MSIESIIDQSIIDSSTHSFQLSPNGMYLSYFTVTDNDNSTFIIKTVLEERLQYRFLVAFQCYDYFWTPDSKRLIFIGDYDGKEKLKIGFFDLTEDSPKLTLVKLKNNLNDSSMRLVHIGEKDGDKILYSSNCAEQDRFDLYQYSFKTGTSKLLFKNTIGAQIFYCNENDSLQLIQKIEEGNSRLFWREANNDWRPIYTATFGSKLRVVKVSSDGIVYLLTDDIPYEYTQLIKINVFTGEQQKISGCDTCDIVGVHFVHNSITWIEFDKEADRYLFSETVDKKILTFLNSYYENKSIRIRNFDKKLSRLIVESSCGFSPSQYDLVWVDDSNTNALDIKVRTLFAPKNNLNKVGPRIENISTLAHDGLVIDSTLFLPSDAPMPVPLVVYVHGGPIGARISSKYQPLISVLLQQGFAVYAPNFRGSAGKGRSFRLSGYGQWASGMLDDILCATESIRQDQRIDSDMMAICGISYGGYAALMLSAKTNMYKTCVSVNPPCDLLDTVNNAPRRWLSRRKELVNGFAGTTDETSVGQCLRENSPINNASRIDQPIYIMASTNDARIRISSVTNFVNELRLKNENCKFIEFLDQGHLINDKETTKRILFEISSWFVNNLLNLSSE